MIIIENAANPCTIIKDNLDGIFPLVPTQHVSVLGGTISLDKNLFLNGPKPSNLSPHLDFRMAILLKHVVC